MLTSVIPNRPFSPDGDPLFDYVVYLNHFDAASNFNVPAVWTDVVGNVPDFISAAPTGAAGKFSNAIYTNCGFAYASQGARFRLDGDFTIEFWLFVPPETFGSPAGWDYGAIVHFGDYGGNNSLTLGADCGTNNFVIWGNTGGYSWTPPTRNTWHHIALQRKSGVGQIFINGLYVADVSLPATYGPNMYVGCSNAYANGGVSNARIDELRVTKKARYVQSNFSEQIVGPYNTVPDPQLSLVKLLAPMDLGVADTIDPADHVVTTIGTPVLDLPSDYTQLGKNMAVFTGANNGTYQQFHPTVDFSFGGSDFTIECLIQPEDPASFGSSAGGLLGNAAAWGGNVWCLLQNGNTHSSVAHRNRYTVWIHNYYSSAPLLISSHNIDTTKPVHLAITRNGTLFCLWINGQLSAAGTYSGFIDSGPSAVNAFLVGATIAGNSNGRFLIDELRVTKSLARYSAGIQKPTERLSASDPLFAKVKALLPMSGMSSLASNGLGLATVVGSTVFVNDAPFGGQSMSFNGALGVATLPSTEFAINATDDFCIECWTKPGTQTNPNASIISNYQSASAGWAAGNWCVQYRADGMFRFWMNNYSVTAPLLVTEVMPAGVWYHVAVTRRKVNDTYQYALFLNGVLKAQLNTTTAYSLTPSTAPVFALGKIDSTTGFYIGLINDVRLTVGDCRYYNDFTPSAIAFDSSDPDYDKVVIHCHYDGSFKDEKWHGYTIGGSSGLGVGFAKAEVLGRNGRDCTYLDGTTRMNTVSHPGYIVGSSDFTIEVEVNPQTSGGQNHIFGSTLGNIGANQWEIAYNHVTNGFEFIWYNLTGTGYACLTSTNPVAHNAWSHIAIVRNGTNVYMFINGVLEARTYAGASVTLDGAAASTLYVGMLSNGMAANARVANAKISKIARYIPTFALESAPYAPGHKDWADTVVLNHFESQTVVAPFLDEKGHTFTATNAAITCNPALFKFGNASMYCDNVGGHGISTPYSADWAFLDSAASVGTLEFWFNCSSYSASTVYNWCSQSNGGGATKKWLLGMNANAVGANNPNTIHLMLSDLVNGSIVGGLCSWAFTPIVGQWYHLALVKNETTYTLYINGVSQGNQTSTLVPAVSQPLFIGCDSESGKAFHGYMDEFRITKAVRYTGNFTPETAEFNSSDPMWAQVGALLHFNASSIPSDVGRPFFANNAAITVSNVRSKFGTSSLKGSGTVNQYAYQKFYSATELYGAGKSFTMDFWIYMDTVPTVVSTLAGQDLGAGSTNKMLVLLNADAAAAYTANRLCLQIQSGATPVRVVGAVTWAAATWTHIAVVKNGYHYTLFVNGNPIVGATVTNVPSVLTDFTLCADAEGYKAFNGYIDEFRIVRKSVYPQTGGNFTPPADLDLTTDPYYSNVLFTAKMDKLEFCNRTMPAVTAGSLTFSTSVKKFGASSIVFNNATYLSFGPRQDYTLASSDFTMEAWVYLNAYNANSSGLLTTAQTLAANTWRWSILATGELNVAVGNYSTSAQLVTTTAKVPLNAWAHVAVVRAGSTFTLFIDGVAGASANFSGALDGGVTATMLMGIAGGSGYLNGYIGEISVNASARYSGNFTPSSSRVGLLPDSRFYITGDTSEGAGSSQLDLVLHPFAWSATTGNPCLMKNTPVKYEKSLTLDGGSAVEYALPDVAIGTQDFCLEFWVYPISRRTYDSVLLGNGVVWKANAWALWAEHHSYRNKFTFWVYNASSSAPLITSVTNVKYGQWQHLAITRKGNTWQMLINGIADSSGGSAASLDGLVASVLRLGNYGVIGQSNAIVDDVRLTVGTSRYQNVDVSKPSPDY